MEEIQWEDSQPECKHIATGMSLGKVETVNSCVYKQWGLQ